MINDSENGLKRKLGLFPLTNIVIANMIGAGIFTTSGLLMAGLHDPLLMIGLWLVGGVLAFCGALSYGQLGAAIPQAGGEYVFLSRLYHPLLGFLSGWVSFFAGFSAPIAASAIGFSEYLTRAFPALLKPGIFAPAVEAVIIKKFLAVLVIITFVLVHSRGIETGSTVQNYLTLLKVALIAGLVFSGFLIGKGSFAHLGQGKDFAFNIGGWKTIGLSLVWIMFAYSGWNASAYIGSEIKNPARNLPRSLAVGTGIVILLYLCLNLFYIYGASPQEMEGVIPVAGTAARNLFGVTWESMLSLLISFALFSSLSAYIILGPRVYYSMARDGYFFRFAGRVHPKYGVPRGSIFLQGIIAAVMVMFGTYDQILTYMGFSLGIFPILAVFRVFKLRRNLRGVTARSFKLKKSDYRMPGFPVIPIIYILVSTAILALSFFERPVESVIALFMALIGVPMFLVFKKRAASQ